ncbi:MAG TPA: class I SAM-dependent methyltransferase [Thermoanaerobaculia bacterium]|nr:class I SAM-dependent methyltransferase [Thermoanaerobaculia bacterium]
MASLLRRVRNRLARLRYGLPPGSRAVAPVVANDLFEAHLGFYLFAGRFAEGRTVCDLGCGTGYGAAELLRAGARSVAALDPDPKSVAFARRRYSDPRITFSCRSFDSAGGPNGSFELIVAGNVLAQLLDLDRAVSWAASHLTPEGRLIASVPPVIDETTLERHRASSFQPNNLYLWEWEDLLRSRFGRLELFGQLPPPGVGPDFAAPGPAGVSAASYRFEPVSLARLEGVGSIAAVFVASEPRAR